MFYSYWSFEVERQAWQIDGKSLLGTVHGFTSYTSFAFALTQNKHTMSHSSPQFKSCWQRLMQKKIRTRDQQSLSKHNPFHTQKMARLVHHAPIKYNIVPSMREEIDFFAGYLDRQEDSTCNRLCRWLFGRWRRFLCWIGILVAWHFSTQNCLAKTDILKRQQGQ